MIKKLQKHEKNMKKRLTEHEKCSNILEYLFHGYIFGPLAQVVEHLTFNQVVRSSSLRWLTKRILNENLAFFYIWPVGKEVNTPPFHGGDMGSNPVRVTNATLAQLARAPHL